MTRFLSGRARALLLLGATALLVSGCVNFTGTKVVTGGESDGPFVVTITCPGADPETEDLTFEGEETESSGDFELDEGATTCTIVETEQAGATSVTYECGEVIIEPIIPPEFEGGGTETGGGPGMSVARRGADNTAECIEGPDGLTVEIFLVLPSEVSVNFTVTNDFTPVPTTAPPTTTTAPPVADPATVLPARGQPTFTG